LFESNCSSCHGLEAQGSTQGPNLIGAGAAAVDFQMSPAACRQGGRGGERAQAAGVHRAADLPDRRLHRLPRRRAAIPDAQQVSTSGADTTLGEQLFSTNCAQCHGFAGSGGALTYGKDAPPLTESTPTQIYERC